jgi:hypothetical protein
MKLAILTPSRSRPHGLYKFFDSINETISGKHCIDLIIRIDKDDPMFNEYYEMFLRMRGEARPGLSVIFMYKERERLAVIWNSMIPLTDADWFVCGNDDEIYLTPEWDVIFFNKVSQYTHPYHMFWFDDGLQHGNHAAFPIVSKEWIAALGYYFPEIFIHNYVDNWVLDIAYRLGTAVYVPEVKHQHLHYSLNLTEFDKTYADGQANDSNGRDRALYINTERERIKCVEILKQKIWDLEH